MAQATCTASVICSRDRKSTRLNSSHLVISYAVFCLKKKKLSHRLLPRKPNTHPRALLAPTPLDNPGVVHRMQHLDDVQIPLVIMHDDRTELDLDARIQ